MYPRKSNPRSTSPLVASLHALPPAASQLRFALLPVVLDVRAYPGAASPDIIAVGGLSARSRGRDSEAAA